MMGGGGDWWTFKIVLSKICETREFFELRGRGGIASII